MKILVINSGSSSIKYALFDSERNFHAIVKHKIDVASYQAAFEELLDHVKDEGIDAVGHRVVHGGETLRDPTVITPAVIEQIKEAGRFVPLHCTPNLLGITLAQEMLPNVPHVAIFDTAAYQSMKRKAFLYGIPLEYYEKHQIRRYGFHGINHGYVAQEAAKILNKENLKVITCHLGSGCSISAFENGLSVDTSMGLTPLEGVIMGSRCGDLDPSILLYLIDVLGWNTEEVSDLLNKNSGLIGICGTQDMRDIVALAKKGEMKAQIALELFVYRIQKYIGAYIAALNGIDAIVFTGGIGENDAYIREQILSCFTYIGAYVDTNKNATRSLQFSTPDSKVTLLTIAANEEWVIAQQTHHLLLHNGEIKSAFNELKTI